MRRKRMGAALVALVVAVGIPSSAFAADIADNAVSTGAVESVTTNNEIISTVQTNEIAEQNKDTVKDESGNLPEADKDVVEKPALEQPPALEPKAEGPVAQEPVSEKPTAEEPVVVVEEPVTTEPAVVVEEPVTTEPAVVVEEPVATEPAIVVEEPVVTQPAIVVTEPAIVVEPATLTINYYGEYGGKSETVTEKVEGYKVGDTVDLTAFINKMVTEYELLYTGEIKEFTIDNSTANVTLSFTVDPKKISEEEFLNPEGKGADDYE